MNRIPTQPHPQVYASAYSIVDFEWGCEASNKLLMQRNGIEIIIGCGCGCKWVRCECSTHTHNRICVFFYASKFN
jgi:hypothetical protein